MTRSNSNFYRLLVSLVLLTSSAWVLAQISNNVGGLSVTGTTTERAPTRAEQSAKADPSPFAADPNTTQSSQAVPTLATPFITLQKIPEPTNKNAIPQSIYQLIANKKYRDALVEIDKELALNPRNVQLRFIRSRTQIELKEIEAAKATLLEITQQFPEIPEPYNNLAVLYAQSGQLEQAKDYLEMALKVQPKFATALENLGDVYTRLAARAYGKALIQDKKLLSVRKKMRLAEDILK